MKSSRRKAWTIRACCYGWSLGGTRMLISIEWFRLYYFRIMIKKLFTYVALVMSVFLLTACPSDDKEDDYNIDTSTSRLVGYWTIRNCTSYTGPNGKLNYKDAYFILYEEGKIRYLNENNNVKEGSWNYNKDTGLLATTAEYRSNNWQWEVSMIEDNEWAGFALWSDDKKTLLAKRDNLINPDLLLGETQWESDDYKIYVSDSGWAKGYNKGSKGYEPVIDFGWGWYDQSNNEMIFEPNNHFKISISHPFSIKKQIMTISGSSNEYYVFKNGVYKRVK